MQEKFMPKEVSQFRAEKSLEKKGGEYLGEIKAESSWTKPEGRPLEQDEK